MLQRLVQRTLSTAAASSSATTASLSVLAAQLAQEASQGVKTPELLQQVSSKAKEEGGLAKLSPDQLAKLAWSLAWLNEKDADFFVKVAKQASSSAGSLTRPQLLQLSWAFAAADVLRLPAVRRFFLDTEASGQQEQASLEPLLYTCVAWTQQPDKPAALPKLLASLTHHDLSQHQPVSAASSADELSTAHEIGLVFRNLVMDKQVAVDVVTDCDVTADVAWPARSVVLDIVTLEDDLLQGGKELNGQAQLKQRLLRNAGWEVHTVKQHLFEAKFGNKRDRSLLEEKKKWLAEHWWPPKA